MTRWIGAAVTTAALAIGLSTIADAQGRGRGAGATGDLWETTSQMSMEGMPMAMPARTLKVCSKKDWTEPPGGQKNCKNTNMQVVGNKVTWDVACTGPTMTGHGEITRQGTTAYAGNILFTTEQGNMTIKI